MHPEAAAINGLGNDLVPTPPHESQLPAGNPSQIPLSFEGICEQARRLSLSLGHHLHPQGARPRLPVRGDGLAHPLRAGLGDLPYDGRGTRARSHRHAPLQLWESARDFQHRQGSQFTSLQWTGRLEKMGIRVSMDGKRRVVQHFVCKLPTIQNPS